MGSLCGPLGALAYSKSVGTDPDIAMQVVGVDDEQPVKYSAKSLLNTEVYQVV